MTVLPWGMPAPPSQASPKQGPLTEEVPCAASAQPRRRLTVRQEVTIHERHAQPSPQPTQGRRAAASRAHRAGDASSVPRASGQPASATVAARTSEATHRAAEGNALGKDDHLPAAKPAPADRCAVRQGVLVPRRTPGVWAVSCPTVRPGG